MLLDILLQLQLPRGETELDHRLYCLSFGTHPSAFVWLTDCLSLSLRPIILPAAATCLDGWMMVDTMRE